MAGTITLTDGVVSIPLVYNASTQPAYRLQYGGRLQISQTVTIEHQPDTAPPLPVFGWDTDRQFFFNLDIGSSEDVNGKYNCEGWDSPMDAIVALKRLVDGDDQQALRYWTEGDVREVFLDVQPDGATTKTRTSIKLGFVDDGAAFYSQFAKSEVALDVVVALRVAPYGHGETFTLNNSLLGASGMLSGSPLADGLNLIGAPTDSIDTDIFLLGGASQEILTDAGTTQGFETDNVTLSGAVDIVASIWLYIETGGDAISVSLVTDIGTIQTQVLTVDDDNNVSDQTTTDALGNTWYRVPVGGTTLPATTVKLVVQRILSPSTATTFYADMVYIGLNETTQPLGWSGRSAMQNEPGSRQNSLYVFGIAGDVEALVTHKVFMTQAGSSNIRNFSVSRGIDGKFLISDQPYWQDSLAYPFAGGTGGGTWTQPAGGSGGSHVQYETAAPPDVGAITATISGEDARKFLATTRRVLARVSASSTNLDFTFSASTPDGIFNGSPNSVNVINQFELVDLGLLNGKNILPDNPPDPLKPDMVFTITIDKITAAGQFARIDGLYFLYADDDFMLGQTLENINTDDEVWIVGDEISGFVVTSVTGQREPRVLGEAYELKEGYVANRIVYTWTELDNSHLLTLQTNVTLEVTPRTRHLLGTI